MTSNETGRTCSRCHEYKLWEEFHRDVTSRTGHKSHCKQCQKAYSDTYTRNPAKNRAARKRWVAKNKEKVNAYQREYMKKRRAKEKE